MNESHEICQSTQQIGLRPATHEDVDFLVALRRSSMHAIVSRHQPWREDEQLERVMHRFDCARIIVIDGSDAGLWKIVREDTSVDLLQIQLLPAYQGRGHGSYLIRNLQAECSNKQVPITLHVFASNPAFRLYQSLGFVVTQRTAEAYFMTWRPSSPAALPMNAPMP